MESLKAASVDGRLKTDVNVLNLGVKPVDAAALKDRTSQIS
jgi:hypothetical protein